MSLYNIIMVILVLAVFSVFLFIFLRPDASAGVLEEEEDIYSLSYLLNGVKDSFDDFLKLNVSELNLNKMQSEKIDISKKELQVAKRTCAVGDKDAKNAIKEFIKQTLVGSLTINEENIDFTIKFSNPEELTIRDKFDILLYVYEKQFGTQAFGELISRNHMDGAIGEESEVHYRISYSQLTTTFNRHIPIIQKLTFSDKLEILTQRIFADYLGLGTIDALRDLDIDGVQCGVSGAPIRNCIDLNGYFSEDCGTLPMVSYNSIWVTYKGKPYDLAPIGFEDERAFERVAKRIYKYDDPGTLSAESGYIVNDMADGSRIVVVRPPMAESWGFFCRKLNVGNKLTMQQLEPYEGVEKLMSLVKFLIAGSANIIITGAQGTGKSTFMMSAIQFIRQTYSIRVQEMAFELNLRMIYPERNIMSLRQTDTVSGQAGLNIQKKMDGSCNLLGEVADQETTRWAIQICQTGSNQLIATHHANSAPDLIKAFSDYSNDRDKLELAATSLNFDIHLGKNDAGQRYVERITAICPHVAEPYSNDLEEATKQYFFRQTDRQVFDCIDILKWENGVFRFTGVMDDRNQQKIADVLTIPEREKFYALCEQMREEAGS